jgi:hypothetical protein
MITTREDVNLELLTRGSVPRHLAPIYGKAPYYPVDPSTSGRACSILNPYVGSYYLSSMTSQGFLIETPIFQPLVGTSRSSSSKASPNRDSIEDYPEIRGTIYWNPTVENRRINMVAPVGTPSHNSYGRYPTIRGSKASEARTPNNRLVQNLNSDFNVVRLQTIMESIQYMVPEDSPLIALAQ